MLCSLNQIVCLSIETYEKNNSFASIYKGIGRDLCERLDALGATVYAISRSVQPLNDLKLTNPNINIISLDLSDWKTSRTQLEKEFLGIKIDGLVNNAGIAICKPVSELTEKDFDE